MGSPSLSVLFILGILTMVNFTLMLAPSSAVYSFHSSTSVEYRTLSLTIEA